MKAPAVILIAFLAVLALGGCAMVQREANAPQAPQPTPLQPLAAEAAPAQPLKAGEAESIRAELHALMRRLDEVESGKAGVVSPVPASSGVNDALPTTIPTRSVLYAVHLASYRLEANARDGWAQILATHGPLLRGAKPRLEAVDLGEKGLFVRLKAGPFDRSSAESACASLKAAGLYCAIDKFNGRPL